MVWGGTAALGEYFLLATALACLLAAAVDFLATADAVETADPRYTGGSVPLPDFAIALGALALNAMAPPRINIISLLFIEFSSLSFVIYPL